MSEKEQIKEMIRTADIDNCDWLEDVLEAISNPYAKGYMTATVEVMDGIFSRTLPDYRHRLEMICDYNIWK